MSKFVVEALTVFAVRVLGLVGSNFTRGIGVFVHLFRVSVVLCRQRHCSCPSALPRGLSTNETKRPGKWDSLDHTVHRDHRRYKETFGSIKSSLHVGFVVSPASLQSDFSVSKNKQGQTGLLKY